MRVPCKAARGVRILGRPRTFRRPKYRPSPRGPTGESNPTASSHTGDGAPARASLRVASVHTRCVWRRGGDYRATRERAVRLLDTSNRASDARSAGGSNLGRAQGARAMPGGMGGEQACGAGLRGAAQSRLRTCKARMMRYCMRTCILVCSPVTAEEPICTAPPTNKAPRQSRRPPTPTLTPNSPVRKEVKSQRRSELTKRSSTAEEKITPRLRPHA